MNNRHEVKKPTFITPFAARKMRRSGSHSVLPPGQNVMQDKSMKMIIAGFKKNNMAAEVDQREQWLLEQFHQPEVMARPDASDIQIDRDGIQAHGTFESIKEEDEQNQSRVVTSLPSIGKQ